MDRALVTGANGFVGVNLVAALAARGTDVAALVRRGADTRRLESLGVGLVRFEGFDDAAGLRQAVSGRSVVYHVAGATKAVAARQLFQVNEGGTRAVARACAEASDPPVLVLVSSLAASGPSTRDRPRVETDPPRPVSQYGRSKRAGELAARQYAPRVPITIVRPGIILGPEDIAGFGLFAPVRRAWLHPAPGGGRERYSIIHVADLCELLILAAERGRRIGPTEDDGPSRAQGCYFAACGELPTFAELGRMLRDAVGRRRVLVLPIPLAGVRAAAAIVDAAAHTLRRPFYLNLDKAREIAAGSWTCSAAAARDELGFAPGVALAQRLAETAAWYREAGWL
ncbi:MAG: NAD-dependent epimerase/dehydratase family protein [Pirellulales bacterium]|nr:NAD-dependent epimerase/dehydratase family protein [Pirellulales bacterium]